MILVRMEETSPPTVREPRIMAGLPSRSSIWMTGLGPNTPIPLITIRLIRATTMARPTVRPMEESQTQTSPAGLDRRRGGCLLIRP